ncbi:CHASE domain-containing protein [Telluria mixta]|nr:CHASE domain-containing protein [Telluria mixta]WEM96402.1 CHASE domain-containing protein [Telluria mixta]
MATTLRDAFSVTRYSFWVGALLSSLVGSVLYLVTARSIESDAETRFVSHARHAQSVINVRVKSYTDLLRATGSMIQSTDVLTYQNFHEFARGLDLAQHFPAVDYINYAVYVPHERRDGVVADLRKNVSRIFGRPVDVDISPPGDRSSYLVVAFVEPAPPGARYYGVDLMANRYFGSQLIEERDRGVIFSAGTPIQVLSQPNNIYLGMRMPVYRGAGPINTVEQRRAAYVGSLGIAFSVRKLLHGVMDEIPIAGLRMTLYDVGPGLDAQGRDASDKLLTLFDSRGTSANPTPALETGDDVFTTTLPLDFNGRLWKTVYSVHKSALYTEFDTYYPKLMMAFGFLGSILLYALLHTLTSSRRAALALAQEMTSELRESQTKLQLSHQKLRRLADHAYQIKEMERKRIAREIHDDLGQSLLALRIEAELLAGRTKGTHSHLHKRARATLLQIDTTIKSVRQIINDLRPTVLDLGLSAAVEWQVNQFQRQTGIQCEIRDDHGEIALPDHCATAFFRILQESLTNIVRHANATHTKVELRLHGGWLSLTVRDNGCGLPPGGRNKYGSFGLVGIEERIVILGGTCAVFSEPDGGTTVMVSAPVIGPEQPVLTQQQEHGSGSAVI